MSTEPAYVPSASMTRSWEPSLTMPPATGMLGVMVAVKNHSVLGCGTPPASMTTSITVDVPGP